MAGKDCGNLAGIRDTILGGPTLMRAWPCLAFDWENALQGEHRA